MDKKKPNPLAPHIAMKLFFKTVAPYLEYSMLYPPVCMKTHPTREENRIILFAGSMAYVGESMSDEKQYISIKCNVNQIILLKQIYRLLIQILHTKISPSSLRLHRKRSTKNILFSVIVKTCLWFVFFSFLQIHSGYAVHRQLHLETLRHFFFISCNKKM